MTARTSRRPAARSRIAALGAVAVAGTLLLSGCGDHTDGAQSGGKTKGSAAPLFSKLPKKIQDKGSINVGSDIAYAPVEFLDDSGKTVGIDPDLAKAMSKQLGVEFKFQSGTFDGLVTGMNSGRYDLIMSAMTDTKNREQGLDDKGKKVGSGADFVNYFQAGSTILVQKGNPKHIRSLKDLCGTTIALQRGTANEDLAKAQSKKCDKPIKILDFKKDTDALVQVRQGRAVADLNDFPVAAYNAKTSGGGKNFQVVGDQIDAAPYGIAVSKTNTKLRDAVQAAVNAIMKNGDYAKVMKKWKVTNGALDKATVNAAGSK